MKQCCYMKEPAGAGSPAGLTVSAFIGYISPLYIPLSLYNPLSLYSSVLKRNVSPSGLVIITPANKLSRKNATQTRGNLGIRHLSIRCLVTVDRFPFPKIGKEMPIPKDDYTALLEPQRRGEE